MPKRKCVFNKQLQAKYPFIKKASTDSDVRCETCRSEFSIAHSGGGDIEAHMKTDKHDKIVSAASSSRAIPQFFNTPSQGDLHMSACEGVWAYHTIDENHSFRSTDCSTKILRICFGHTKFSCSRTKCEAIITNVFFPYNYETLKEELANARFICLLTDASNHGNIKMFPVLIRYFLPTIGVRVKILEFSAENGETGEIISQLLKNVLTSHNLFDKFVAFCGDNAPTNFGNINRGGDKNVFARLKELKQNIIGIGCGGHIVHNALRFACDQLPFDIECIVVKIYSHFYIYTVRLESLKSFCNSVGEEYERLLGYSKTRFLALKGAIESIIKNFAALKAYFQQLSKCPKILVDFFNSPLSKLWLYFIRDQVFNC